MRQRRVMSSCSHARNVPEISGKERCSSDASLEVGKAVGGAPGGMGDRLLRKDMGVNICARMGVGFLRKDVTEFCAHFCRLLPFGWRE